MDRLIIDRAKELFRKFDEYPTTSNSEEYRTELGGMDAPEYWTAYNEHYGTSFPGNIKTIRNCEKHD